MVCPYNDFKECFKGECPFFNHSTDIINGHYVNFDYCERAKKEKREK